MAKSVFLPIKTGPPTVAFSEDKDIPAIFNEI